MSAVQPPRPPPAHSPRPPQVNVKGSRPLMMNTTAHLMETVQIQSARLAVPPCSPPAPAPPPTARNAQKHSAPATAVEVARSGPCYTHPPASLDCHFSRWVSLYDLRNLSASFHLLTGAYTFTGATFCPTLSLQYASTVNSMGSSVPFSCPLPRPASKRRSWRRRPPRPTKKKRLNAAHRRRKLSTPRAAR